MGISSTVSEDLLALLGGAGDVLGGMGGARGSKVDYFLERPLDGHGGGAAEAREAEEGQHRVALPEMEMERAVTASFGSLLDFPTQNGAANDERGDESDGEAGEHAGDLQVEDLQVGDGEEEQQEWDELDDHEVEEVPVDEDDEAEVYAVDPAAVALHDQQLSLDLPVASSTSSSGRFPVPYVFDPLLAPIDHHLARSSSADTSEAVATGLSGSRVHAAAIAAASAADCYIPALSRPRASHMTTSYASETHYDEVESYVRGSTVSRRHSLDEEEWNGRGEGNSKARSRNGSGSGSGSHVQEYYARSAGEGIATHRRVDAYALSQKHARGGRSPNPHSRPPIVPSSASSSSASNYALQTADSYQHSSPYRTGVISSYNPAAFPSLDYQPRAYPLPPLEVEADVEVEPNPHDYFVAAPSTSTAASTPKESRKTSPTTSANGDKRKRTEIPAVEDDESIRPYGCNYLSCITLNIVRAARAEMEQRERQQREKEHLLLGYAGIDVDVGYDLGPAPSTSAAVMAGDKGKGKQSNRGDSNGIQTSFRTVKELREHATAHRKMKESITDDMPFRCALDPCGKTFKSAAGLRWHFQNASNGHFFVSKEEGEVQPTKKFKLVADPNERNTACPVRGCSKSFKQGAGLAYHLAHTANHRVTEAMIATFPVTLASKVRWWFNKKCRPILDGLADGTVAEEEGCHDGESDADGDDYDAYQEE